MKTTISVWRPHNRVLWRAKRIGILFQYYSVFSHKLDVNPNAMFRSIGLAMDLESECCSLHAIALRRPALHSLCCALMSTISTAFLVNWTLVFVKPVRLSCGPFIKKLLLVFNFLWKQLFYHRNSPLLSNWRTGQRLSAPGFCRLSKTILWFLGLFSRNGMTFKEKNME